MPALPYRIALTLAVSLLAVSGSAAREIYVNNQSGSNESAGTAEAPFRTARKAISVVGEGDVIHLLPKKVVYREMITIRDKGPFTIEGHDCTVSAADPLPSNPAEWEAIGPALHRIRLRRTIEDRHVLVVNGAAQMMGRTKYMIQAAKRAAGQEGDFEALRAVLTSQYPKPADLNDGQFAWEPIDMTSGWLYVKGPLANLEWSVRSQCIYTTGRSDGVAIRNLHARFALNDGFNLHGAALDYRLQNVTAYGCFDNGISPHGACSFTAEDSRFWGNEMALGNDFATQTHFVRCELAGSTQEEIMCIGGKHLFEDCRIRAAGPVAIRLIHTKRSPQFVLNEIKLAGADPEMKSEVTFRNCTVESADGPVRQIVTQPGPSVAFERCVFKGIEFKPEKASNVKLIDCTLDGRAIGER
ncbi:MAG: hypothetical protein HY000_17495 [Planctomycetes bacterium]|nr:hypothetical protein [Planctomycetota bacterium]